MAAPTFPSSSLFPYVWRSGGANQGAINSIPAATTGTAVASFADGFPAVTMQVGGVPPVGADFNGILNQITTVLQWLSVGGQAQWSGAVSTTPSYPVGAVIQLNSGLGAYVNTLAGNTNDPNSVTTNWNPWAGSAMQTWVAGQLGSYLTTTSAASTYASLANLAGTTNTTGSALVGFSSGVAYPAGSVGLAVNKQHGVRGGSSSYVSPATGWSMMGCQVAFTPRSTGNVMIFISSSFNFVATTGAIVLSAYYGTGTAPTQGAAPTGSPIGAVVQTPSLTNASSGTAFGTAQYVSGVFTVGTTYWLDLAVNISQSGQYLPNAYVMAVEV